MKKKTASRRRPKIKESKTLMIMATMDSSMANLYSARAPLSPLKPHRATNHRTRILHTNFAPKLHDSGRSQQLGSQLPGRLQPGNKLFLHWQAPNQDTSCLNFEIYHTITIHWLALYCHEWGSLVHKLCFSYSYLTHDHWPGHSAIQSPISRIH